VCLSRCWICFTHMLQVFYLLRMFPMVFECLSGVFISVSNACFKCFICLQTYVSNAASGCLKSRSGCLAHVASYCSCWMFEGSCGANATRGRARAQTPRRVGWGTIAVWGQAIRAMQEWQMGQSRAGASHVLEKNIIQLIFGWVERLISKSLFCFWSITALFSI
jgi:hypothetical protein